LIGGGTAAAEVTAVPPITPRQKAWFLPMV